MLASTGDLIHLRKFFEFLLFRKLVQENKIIRALLPCKNFALRGKECFASLFDVRWMCMLSRVDPYMTGGGGYELMIDHNIITYSLSRLRFRH